MHKSLSSQSFEYNKKINLKKYVCVCVCVNTCIFICINEEKFYLNVRYQGHLVMLEHILFWLSSEWKFNDKQVILTQPIITFYISISGVVSSLFTHTQICWLCLICSTKSYLGKCEQNWLMNLSPSGTKASEIQTPIPSYEHY